MYIEYFDVNRIVSIVVCGERPVNEYEWREPSLIKKFFGLINTGKFTEAGYYSKYGSNKVPYTEEELRGYGYKVYSRNERINTNVVNKAYVKVYLEHDNRVREKFETEDEMQQWVEKIKTTSGKTFEIVNIE